MSKKSFWVLFGAIQAAGLIASRLANVHIHPFATILALVLLLPGILLGSVTHFPDGLIVALAVPINAGAWYVLGKILRPT